MKMATENLKGEQQRRLEARKNYIEQRLKPLEDLHSLSDGKNFPRKKKTNSNPNCLFSSNQITLSRTS
jgi:hypothetical protein